MNERDAFLRRFGEQAQAALAMVRDSGQRLDAIGARDQFSARIERLDRRARTNAVDHHLVNLISLGMAVENLEIAQSFTEEQRKRYDEED